MKRLLILALLVGMGALAQEPTPVYNGPIVIRGGTTPLTVIKNSDFRGTHTQTGNVVITPLAAPGAPTVTPTPGGGATTWGYKVVACLDALCTAHTTASVETDDVTGGADLLADGSVKETVSWAAVTGALFYNLRRIAWGGTCRGIACVGGSIGITTLTNFEDTGQVGDATTTPLTNTTGTLTLPAMTAGSVPFFGAGGLLSEANSNFYWDSTNKQLQITANPSSTNTILDVLKLTRSTTGTAGNGIGTGLVLYAEDASGNIEEAGRFQASFPNATHATQTGRVDITAMGAAAGVSVQSDGQVAVRPSGAALARLHVEPAAGLQGAIINENGAALATGGLIGGSPALLTLEAGSASPYYQLGYIIDGVGSIANYQVLDGNYLQFDHSNSAGSPTGSNWLDSYGGHGYQSYTSDSWTLYRRTDTYSGLGKWTDGTVSTNNPLPLINVFDAGTVRISSPSTLGGESLNETAFTTHAKWDTTGDFNDTAGNAKYTHNTGVGTLTQTAVNMLAAGAANRFYRFPYLISGLSGDVACSITTTFAAEATPLNLTAGAQTTDFLSAAAPGSFVISCTSTVAGGVTLDDVSLKPVAGGDLIVDGKVGIGTAAPAEKHHVYNGNSRIDYGHLRFISEATPGAPTSNAPTAGGSCTAGTHVFVTTFVTANGETQYGAASAAQTCGANATVPLSAIPTGTSGVTTGRNICASKAGTTTPLYQVGASPTIADNSTTTYNFVTADGSLTVACNATDTTTGGIWVDGTQKVWIDSATGFLGIGGAPYAGYTTVLTPLYVSSISYLGGAVSLGGGIGTYKAIATVSNGIPAIYGTVDLTAQTSAIGATTIYANPATTGQYRVCYLALTKKAGDAVNLAVQLSFTTPDDSSTAQSIASANVAINTVGAYTQGCPTIVAKASTNIQYATTLSGGIGAGEYSLWIKVEKL